MDAALKKKDPEAQYEIGQMYLALKNRKGLAKETRGVVAARWFVMAATSGHVEAMKQVSTMYKAGFGFRTDPKIAKQLTYAVHQAVHDAPHPDIAPPKIVNLCLEAPKKASSNNGMEPYFSFTYSKRYENFVSDTGLDPYKASTAAEFRRRFKCGYVHQIATAKIAQAIKYDELPVLRDSIPSEVLKEADNLAAKGHKDLYAREIANYLSDEAPFRAYDLALKSLDANSQASVTLRRTEFLKNAKAVISRQLFQVRLAPNCSGLQTAMSAANTIPGDGLERMSANSTEDFCEFSLTAGFGKNRLFIGAVDASACSEGACTVSYRVICQGEGLVAENACRSNPTKTEYAQFTVENGKFRFVKFAN